MRYVIALGGNALLQRFQRPDAGIQRRHVRVAAAALAPVIAGHQVLICHGSGPQIGMLANESDDPELAEPFGLDTLGAQTQGMIGYWLAQELANAGVTAPVAVVRTQTLVDPADPAFAAPTKFIGPSYPRSVAEQLAVQRRWTVAADTAGWRRVVASPEPRRLLELSTIAALAAAGTVVVCAGGGGVPVVSDAGGLRGVDAVVDKDLTAALLAVAVHADRLVLLTDVHAVLRDFGRPNELALTEVRVGELDEMTFPPGSMGPKVEAAKRFATATGRPAVIGSLAEAASVLSGASGTTILADADHAHADADAHSQHSHPPGPGLTEPKRLRPNERTRTQVEQVMRRIGLSDRIAEAHRMLPEVVDLDRDGQLLSGLGLSMDRIVDGLGAGPW
jgi:carbamate kinase